MKNTLFSGRLCRNTTFHLPKVAAAIAFALTLLTAEPMHAQFQVLHYFTGGTDGGSPQAGVTVGGSGTLYGTTPAGGSGGGGGNGLVFKLSERNGAWTLDPLYEFTGGNDGGEPFAGVVIGPNGALYGTTNVGGSAGAGTVFELRPPGTACKTAICYWNETVLYSFAGAPRDGAGPTNLVFDHAGKIYGATSAGGEFDCGTLWKLAPSGGGWTESILDDFTGQTDGCIPSSGVVLDGAGNLYGTTDFAGRDGQGTVYGGGATVALNQSTGTPAYGTLIVDPSGNVYGTSAGFDPNGNGTVYEYSRLNGGSVSVVYSFSACHPYAGVTLGPDGNLYGVCFLGGAHDFGWVFEMPPNCNQTCTPNDLHDFDYSDGAGPTGSVVFDASGNLYGTAQAGGNAGCNNGNGCGVVWEIAGVGARR